MNHELLRRALAVCQVSSNGWLLGFEGEDDPEWFWQWDTATRGSGGHEASVYMTAAWLGWLGSKGRARFPIVHELGNGTWRVSIERVASDDSGIYTSFVSPTILEALAEAVVVVGENRENE